jgi:PAS domain S-box-containing protein
MLNHTPERYLHDRLGSALYKLAIIEQRSSEPGASQRTTSKLLSDVRKLAAELQRGFADLQELMARTATAEQAANAAMSRAQLLFDLSPVACLVLDAEGMVVDANPAAAQLLNISNRHLIGKSFPIFLTCDRETFVQRLCGLSADGGRERWSARLRPRERSAVACALVAAGDADGRILVLATPEAAGHDGDGAAEQDRTV